MDHQWCIIYYFSLNLASLPKMGHIIVLLVDQFRVFGVLSVLSLFTNAIV
ncbi:hypothetical protein G9563_000963 [Salmonella enterica]|nr:hypothetical protein [Salmonella enterica subsp. enterica serovar Redlands]EEL2874325.1 hypothetical protein [Salmonella enterica]EHE9224998.1 hypothetical protein [Salmonella enterica]EIQ2464116.1 hypothetical protein [Salmonella enterica]HDY3111025.1 hypothetical protein [Salmonella enterica]